MQQELPGKLLAGTAYENHRLAPSKVEKFPPNVFMLLCLHEQPYNLPLSSPAHDGERSNIEAWSKKCGMLGVWDYILLDEHKNGNWHTPTPLVSALVDRYQWLANTTSSIWAPREGTPGLPVECLRLRAGGLPPGT